MLQQFADDSCKITSEVVPTSYHAGIRRWLYFIDRSSSDPTLNLRDLVLLPCNPNDIARLYCVTLGIHNAPGATAAGTSLMREFGLALKLEQAYDSLSGDVGSKKCAVVFPPGKTPRDFDTFIAERVAKGTPGSHLIRRAAETQIEVKAEYSTHVEAFFGQYVYARRYLPGNARLKPIDEVRVQQDPGTIHPAPQTLVLRLTDAQRSKVERELKSVYGDEHALEGRFVQVSCDSDFEALSFSFLNPDDILCLVSLTFGGDSDEVNTVVRWLGERRVDFRQYQIVENESDASFEFRLLCDLSQTDLHLFDRATLRELLFAELEYQLRATRDGAPSGLRTLEVAYKNDTLVLYNEFTERHRFRLLSIVLLDERATPLNAWPEPLDDPALLGWVAGELPSASVTPSTRPVPDQPRRYITLTHHPRHPYAVLALYDNRPPTRFEAAFRHFCAQLPAHPSSEGLAQTVRKYLLRGLRYDFLPSLEEFQALGTLPREQFLHDNDQRFSTLGWSYVTEKWERDHFPIRGNIVLASMLGTYLADQPELRRRLAHTDESGRIRICDIGPGVGALTTVLALRRNAVLWENLDRLDVVFVDAAHRVLDLNQDGSGYRDLPEPLLEDLQLSHEEDLDAVLAVLRRSTYVCCDVSDPVATRSALAAAGVKPFDIVYSAFCHHHMNIEMKRAACRAMLACAREGAFVGVADESLTYKQYLLYRIGHSMDQVAIATESYFSSPDEHAACFGDGLHLMGKEHRPRSKFYAFWGQVTAGAPPSNDVTFDVFLCHSSDDKEILRKINAAMRRQGLATWFDEEQLEGGQIWQDELEKQIGRVRKACIFVGPKGERPWQRREVRAFLNQSADRGCTLIPVLLPGTPEKPDLPMFLRDMMWVDLRSDFDRNLERLIKTLKASE